MIGNIACVLVIVVLLIEGTCSIIDAFRNYKERKRKNDARTVRGDNDTINGDFREDSELF